MNNVRAKVIVRLMGGPGNQLFEYAAARRLALRNDVPLYLDAVSGFQRDFYRRTYILNWFSCEERFAAPGDCYQGITGRLRRGFVRGMNRQLPFEKRSYIREPFFECDERLLTLRVRGRTYLEGYWQSPKYFEDIAPVLRRELRFKGSHEEINVELARRIEDTASVCLHVRRLRGTPSYSADTPEEQRQVRADRVDMDYYRKAVALMARRVRRPHFFVFSDDPVWVRENIRLDYPATFVDHNAPDTDGEDLWLMTCCKYFIIAYSTFSWWGAWLSEFEDKIVCAPFERFDNKVDMMPEGWINIR